MPKASNILNKNCKKNKNAMSQGVKLYDDMYEKTRKLLKDNNEMYQKVLKNIKGFVDTREIEHIIMAYYPNCIDDVSGELVFNEVKYKEYIDEFISKLSFDVKSSDKYQKLYEKNNSKDELGLNIFERYYYDTLEPYFDNVYKLLPKIEKLNYDIFTKVGKYSVYDFYLKTYAYRFDQGFFENISKPKNHYYFDKHYKNFDDVKQLKQEIFFNMISQYEYLDILKKEGIEKTLVDPMTGYMYLANFDKSAIDSYIKFMNDPSKLELEFDSELYSLLDDDVLNEQFRKKLELKLTLCSSNNNHNFKLKHDYDNIFIDGKRIEEYSLDSKEMWKIVAKKILEGNHAIEIVNVFEYDSKIKTEIIPVKFIHNNKEYNKVHYSWLQRFLNFVGIMHNTRNVEEIESNNFNEKQINSEERHKMINETILKDVLKYNDEASINNDVILGFECINKELNVYNKEAVDVVEINEKLEEKKEDVITINDKENIKIK